MQNYRQAAGQSDDSLLSPAQRTATFMAHARSGDDPLH